MGIEGLSNLVGDPSEDKPNCTSTDRVKRCREKSAYEIQYDEDNTVKVCRKCLPQRFINIPIAIRRLR